ncbi:MAG: proline dehydrogenase family protein [Bacteroidales bacterium]
MQIFENTEIAFRSRSTGELKKASLLFRFMSRQLLVKISGVLANLGLQMSIPLGWLVRPTVFSHFCGGETLDESRSVIEHLAKFRVRSILDYAAENQSTDKNVQEVMKETLRTIDFASENSDIPFAVFKPTAFAPVSVLSAASSYAPLSTKEKKEIEKFENNISRLCQAAYEKGVPVLIDAEESYYQAIVDKVASEMMEKYNKDKAVVFNTLQMYRHDRLKFLNECITISKEKNYHLGIKLVRGAYMDQERERSRKMGYPSPIYPDKESTDKAFNTALSTCIGNLDRVSVFVGTHNEDSLLILMDLLKKIRLKNDDSRVYVSQLYGMSDHISFNMAVHGYNVAKYLPYGPVTFLLPYLIRRAEENKSVSGQAGRELRLIEIELERRKKSNNP